MQISFWHHQAQSNSTSLTHNSWDLHGSMVIHIDFTIKKENTHLLEKDTTHVSGGDEEHLAEEAIPKPKYRRSIKTWNFKL